LHRENSIFNNEAIAYPWAIAYLLFGCRQGFEVLLHQALVIGAIAMQEVVANQGYIPENFSAPWKLIPVQRSGQSLL
jgi:hypothetical protein